MIKTVFFDLDGTLLNRDESVRKFIDSQYERLNKWLSHIPKAQYVSRFIELDNHGYVWKDKVYQQMSEEFKITGLSWEKFLQDYVSNFKHFCVPFNHLIEVLEELKNNHYELGMITNGFGQFQMDNIRALGIEKYFSTILVSEWEGVKKPDPTIFLRALAELDVVPNQSIYVGDHPENDVIASKTVGMIGIWKRDNNWRDFETDLMMDDLDELPSIIASLRH